MHNIKKELLHYLAYVAKTLKKRERMHLTIQKYSSHTGIIDMPKLGTIAAYNSFVVSIEKYGYEGVNIGLTPIRLKKIPPKYVQTLLNKKILKSFHGTSLKRSIKANISYKSILKQDKNTIDALDPQGKIGINYDLYAGHDIYVSRQKSFKATQQDNTKKLGAHINGGGTPLTAYHIREHIITTIASVHKDRRPIYIEIPGTRGRSMMPDISDSSLQKIVLLLKKYLPRSGRLCLDIGHIFTRSRTDTDIAKVLGLIKKYKKHIRMLHISSAGSYNKHFQVAYNNFTNNKYPTRHTRGLDFQGVIYEKKMLQFIATVRKILKNQYIIEVCESRLPSISIKDYFETNILGDEVDSVFFDQIQIQAKVLGYKSP